MRVAIFYINYGEELSEGLKEVIKQVEQVREEMIGIEMDIYVLGRKKGEEQGIKYRKIWKGRSALEEARVIFKEISILQKRKWYEFVVIGDEEIMINSLDYIGAIRNRLMKNRTLGMLGNICTEQEGGRGVQVLSVLGIRQVIDILERIQNEREEVEIKGWKDIIEIAYKGKYERNRIWIEKLEGIKGYREGVSEDVEEYNMVRVGGIEEKKEYVEKYKNRDKRSELEKMIEGKSVAIIGNGEVREDKSEEIDSAEVVIRINNFYNYDSGKVGKRIDGLILTGYSACMETEPSQKEYIQEQKPKLFLLNESINQRIEKLNEKFDGCEIHMLGNQSMETLYTTGTILLKKISQMSNIKSVKLYGFSEGEEWNAYLDEFAQLHRDVCGKGNEEELRKSLIQKWLQ